MLHPGEEGDRHSRGKARGGVTSPFIDRVEFTTRRLREQVCFLPLPHHSPPNSGHIQTPLPHTPLYTPYTMPDTATKFSGWGAFGKDSIKGNLVSPDNILGARKPLTDPAHRADPASASRLSPTPAAQIRVRAQNLGRGGCRYQDSVLGRLR